MRHALLALLLTTACAREADSLALARGVGDDDTVGVDGLEDAPCAAEVTWIEPEADFRYVATDAPIEAGFSEPLPRWAEWSLEVEGVTGTATLSADARVATFVPEAPLEHERRYLVRAEACGRSRTQAFGTRPPPVGPEHLLDRAWGIPADAVELLSATASLLLPYVSFDGFVLTARPDPRAPGVQRLFALLDVGPGTRTHCRAEIDLGRLDLTDSPRFTTAPTDVRVPTEAGGEVSLAEVLVSGTFGGLGERLLDARLQAHVDVRPIEDHLGDGVDLCAAAAIMGEPCGSCVDGTPHCLTMILTVDEASDWSDAADSPRLPPLCP